MDLGGKCIARLERDQPGGRNLVTIRGWRVSTTLKN